MIPNKLVELQKIQIGLEEIIAKEVLLNPEIEIEDYLSTMIKIRVQGFLWGEAGRSTTIKYPSDWWQAFKLEYFPVWALKRWPVKYTEHTINTRTLYPNFRVSLPKEYHVLHFMISTENAIQWGDVERAWND